MIRQHVALFVYLCQSFLGTLVNLQFEDVYGVLHVHHGISSTDGTLHLRADIDVEETKHQIEYGLIVLLAMVLQIVWDRSHIGAHVFQCCFDIIAVNRLAKSQEEGVVIGTARVHIVRYQRIEQTITDLLVWDAQSVFAKHRIILLDGQITALIKQRQGVCHFLCRLVEGTQNRLLTLQRSKVDMILIQQFQEERWRARTKPVRSYLACVQRLHQAERIEDVF